MHVRPDLGGRQDLCMTAHPDQWFGDKTYSQHGEDLLVACIFKHLGVERGSYLDIGAHHPENISNTALLYARGWRGINVEANPNLIELFREKRPEDRNISAAVVPVKAPNETTRPLYMIDRLSGRNTMDLTEAMRFCDNEGKGRRIEEFVGVPVMSIPEVLAGSPWPDFLTIDVEGLDYDLLWYADFSASAPKVVCAEVRAADHRRFCGMMTTKAFKALARMGENVIFVGEEHYARAMGVYK